MNTNVIINGIASIVTMMSVVGFMIMLEAPTNPYSKYPIHLRIWVKSALILISTGCLFNILTLSAPQWTEIVLNCGFATLFSWAFYIHNAMWKSNKVID